jgi:integrase
MPTKQQQKKKPRRRGTVFKTQTARYGEAWNYDATIKGVRVRRSGFSSRAAAETALAIRRTRANEIAAGVLIEPTKAPSVTVKELVERRTKQLTRKVTGFILKRWLETLPEGLRLVDLQTAHLSTYADARLALVKPQTVFRELTDICSLLARARDLFPSLEAWTPPRRPKMTPPSGRRERVITQHEARQILAHLRRPQTAAETATYYAARLDAADLFQIALLTAARRAEILALRWTDVNFEWQTLRVVGTKTDKIRVLPMTPALVALLERRKAAAGPSARVFPALDGSTMLRANTDQIYRAASKDLSIPYGRDTAGGWVLHDARHTAITAMLHAGHSIETVMAISGHSARVMAMRYAHANEQTKRAAVDALESFAA